MNNITFRPAYTPSSFYRSPMPLPLFNGLARKEEHKDIFVPRAQFAGKLPKIVVALMPDGREVTLEESVELGSDGQPKARSGKFTFDDPENGTKDGKGYIEYESVTTPECVDLQYIWNNSTQSGGIALVAWHLTKNINREEFKGTDIENDDIYLIGQKYGLKKEGTNIISGPFQTVKTLAKQKLLKTGWTLK